ncbi:hypothetical protein Tco_1335933 [Tanacetum coccineum]
MVAFPRLDELAVAAKSRSLFDVMMLYFERETMNDIEFAADLHNLWVQFIDHTNDRKLFISELEGVPSSLMSYSCCQFLHQVQQDDFIKLLTLREMIAETYREVHKKIDFISVMKNMLQCAEFLKQLCQTEVVKMLEIRKTISEVHIQVHKKIDFLIVMRRGQTFNWKSATCGKVSYFDDFDYLKDFENKFPAIVYNDALTLGPEISSEPTVSPLNENHIDFRISFDESGDEDYTVIYDKNLFPYNDILISDDEEIILLNKEVYKAERFEVIRYSLGTNKEYIAISTCECDSWKRTNGTVSNFYREIFHKRDLGWLVKCTK